MTSWQRALVVSGLKPTAKHVALTLSLHADWKTGENAHPGAPLLSRETGLVERTVRGTLATLVDSGWLTLVARGGRAGGNREANTYSLLIPKHALRCTGALKESMQENAGSSTPDAPRPVTTPPTDDSVESFTPVPAVSIATARRSVPKGKRSGQVTPIFKAGTK